jgi:pimeloyl-ACP methyl ester carboxylesterase
LLSAPLITEHALVTPEHTTSYLAGGPTGGPLLIFVHGWPAVGRTWKHQLACFAALGFRVVAPDMRGYGNSTVHDSPGAYAQEHIVSDMLALLDHLGRGTAVWIGHNWGSATVWNLAALHPERTLAVASLCVPYATLERGVEAMLPLIDRGIYPAADYPAGQFDYQVYYEHHSDEVTAMFDASPEKSVKIIFQSGNPAVVGQVSPLATITRDGGWFGGTSEVFDFPLDTGLLDEADFAVLAASLSRNGFGGPTGYYLNHKANAAYAAGAANDGRLDQPVLFLGADYDFITGSVDSGLTEPMRRHCRDLTERTVKAGHWLALERPAEVNAALAQWLATSVPAHWPASSAPGREGVL